MTKETLDFVTPPLPPKNYKISSAFSYNFKLALTASAPVESQQPDPSPEPEKPKTGNGLLAIVGLVLLAGGGAACFVIFKKKKPDVKGSADLDEYDYGDEDDPDDGPEDE